MIKFSRFHAGFTGIFPHIERWTFLKNILTIVDSSYISFFMIKCLLSFIKAIIGQSWIKKTQWKLIYSAQ